jgi:hypothetical protein
MEKPKLNTTGPDEETLTRDRLHEFAHAIGGGGDDYSRPVNRAEVADRLAHHCAIQGIKLNDYEWIQILQRDRDLRSAALNNQPPRDRTASIVTPPSVDEMLATVACQFDEILKSRCWDDDPIGGEIDRLVEYLEQLDPELACGYIEERLMTVYAEINNGLLEPVGLFSLRISVVPWLEPLPETRGRIQAISSAWL